MPKSAKISKSKAQSPASKASKPVSKAASASSSVQKDKPKKKRQLLLSEQSVKQIARNDLIRSLHKVTVDKVLEAGLALPGQVRTEYSALLSRSQVGEYEDYVEFIREFFDYLVDEEEPEESEISTSETEADEKAMEEQERLEDEEELSDEDMFSEDEQDEEEEIEED